MPDLYMNVDVALSEVPVNIIPLIDDTDFKTRETGITYNQAGMDLVWNFITTDGAFSQTAVTPTTGGNYDWTNQGDGMYTIEIPASGGASINNDTEGFGWFTGICTGVLAWRGPIIGFRAAGINNLLMDSAYSATRGLAGTALPDAVADSAGGLPISDTGGLDLDSKLANTNEVTSARMGALTDWIDGGRLDLLLDAIKAVTDDLATTSQLATAIVDEWETQSQTDPTGFQVNVMEVNGTSQTANDNGADINEILIDTGTSLPANQTLIYDRIGSPSGASVSADINEIDTKIGTNTDAAGTTTLFARVRQIVETYLADGVIGLAQIETLIDDLESRLSAARAGYLDNLNGHVAQTGDNFSRIGANGAGLSAIPWNSNWDAEVQSEMQDAIEANNLDHLMKIAVANNADMTAEVIDGTVLSNMLSKTSDTSSYVVADDALEAISDSTGGGVSNPNLLLDAEIAVVSSQTEFTLVSGSDVDNAYNDQAIVLYDNTNSDYPSIRIVTDYIGATRTVTIDNAPDFTLADDDSIKIFVTAPGTTAPTAAQIRIEMDDNSTRLASIDSNSFVGLQGGLLLNFRINEKDGSYIYDKLHSDYKGMLDSDITFSEGVKGKALKFYGVGSVNCQIHWNETKYSGNPLIVQQSAYQQGLYTPCIIDVGDEVWCYHNVITDDLPNNRIRVGLSISTDGGYSFDFYGYVLEPSDGEWDSRRNYQAYVFYDSDDAIYKMWYNGDDNVNAGIGYAASSDGKTWTKYAGNPVFEKGEAGNFDDYGVATPCVLKESGTYYMFYTGQSDYLINEGMGLASSADGITWARVQTTPVLAGTNFNRFFVKKYDNVYYVIFKIQYDDNKLYSAYSTDKINWTINYHPWMRLDANDWDNDGTPLNNLQDAGWYSLDNTEAKFYYAAASIVRTDDKIGLITIPNFIEKIQETELLDQYPISISLWIKTTDSGASRGIIKRANDTPPVNGFNIYISGGRLKAFYSLDNSNIVNMTGISDDGGIINDGLWHHIIFTVDSGGGEIFVDLVSQNTKAWTGTPGAISTTELLKIGKYSNILTGEIDDVRIYDHVLSADERRGIVVGIPYVEDNTLEIVRDQETMPELINDEIVDALNVDTYSEPGQGVPAANTSIVAKLGYLYKSWRNKKDNDGIDMKIYNDAGDIVDQKSAVSKDGGTVIVGKMGSGE